MAFSFANNFTTTLNGNISSGAATLTPTTATGSPSTGPFTIMVYVLTAGVVSNAEIMLVTAGFGTTTWTVTRAQEGTAAVSHASGEQISQITTVAGLQSLGNQFWPYLSPSGLTGATAATRYVGATASGAPLSGGPFAAGDFVIAQTGQVFVCVGAGSPGTWSVVGVPLLGYATITTGGGGVGTTPAALSGYSVTATPLASRVIEVTAVVQWGGNTQVNNIVHTLYRDGVSLSVSESVQMAVANQNATAFKLMWLDVAPSSSSHTWTIQANTNLGSANNSVTTANPGYMTVKDIGPQ